MGKPAGLLIEQPHRCNCPKCDIKTDRIFVTGSYRVWWWGLRNEQRTILVAGLFSWVWVFLRMWIGEGI